MVPMPLARARAMRSRTCADFIQPCRLHAHLATPVDSLSRLYSGAVLGSGYSSITGTMLPSVAAVTSKAFLARANGKVRHGADVHDVKFIELYSVTLKLE